MKRPELLRLAARGGATTRPNGRGRRRVLYSRASRRAILAALLLALASAASPRTDPGAGGIEIALSPAGDLLGPITARTPFSAAELRSLFAGAVVTEATDASEGELYPMLRIADRSRTLLEIRSADGKAIYSVEIMPGARVDNLGVRHGETYAQVFGAGPRRACEPGLEEQSGQVICPAPTTSHVSLVFDGSWDGPDGELPPPEDLRAWTVERIVWRP